MSTPITHESSSHALAEDAEIRDVSEWRRQITGLVIGLGLALVIYLVFPTGAADVVAKADPELDVSYEALG